MQTSAAWLDSASPDHVPTDSLPLWIWATSWQKFGFSVRDVCTCHFPYLYPVEDLLIAGHVLQEKSLQLLAQLLRRQDPFRRRSLSAGAVQQNELQFLFVSTNDEEATNQGKNDKEENGCADISWFDQRAFSANLLWDESLDILSVWQEVSPVEARFPPQRTHSPMALSKCVQNTFHSGNLSLDGCT